MEKKGSPSDYLAAERTLLAWIRTGLALMGFGFVVAKFDLFLKALERGQHDLAVHGSGALDWIGAALMMLGVLVNILSVLTHLRQVRMLDAGEDFKGASRLGIGVAGILAVIGIAMAAYVVPNAQAATPVPLSAVNPAGSDAP